MKLTYTNIIEALKKKKPRDFVYPGVLVVFFITVAIMFFTAVQFISKNINNVFSSDQNTDTQPLDMTRYTKIAKKLNLTLVTPLQNEASSTKTNADTTMTTAPQALAFNKKSLTLMILNSTPKKGVASTLSKILIDAGFAKSKTGNEKTAYAVTTIFIKNSKYDYAPLLLEAILKSYPEAQATTTSDTAPFDATIIIGKN